MSFGRWLQRHIAEDSPTGDLARTARFARIRARSLDAWGARLRTQGASWRVLELLREAWEQYEAGAKPPAPGSAQPPRADERWTIKRPALPNWIGTPPSLLWVRRDVLPEDVPPPVVVACGAKFMAAVEQYGRYFRREFSYDFLPYRPQPHRER